MCKKHKCEICRKDFATSEILYFWSLTEKCHAFTNMKYLCCKCGYSKEGQKMIREAELGDGVE